MLQSFLSFLNESARQTRVELAFFKKRTPELTHSLSVATAKKERRDERVYNKFLQNRNLMKRIERLSNVPVNKYINLIPDKERILTLGRRILQGKNTNSAFPYENKLDPFLWDEWTKDKNK